MKAVTAKQLLRKYAEGTCSEAERYLFEQWYNGLNAEDRLQLTEIDLEEAEKVMLHVLQKKIERPGRILVWYRVAAAIVILFSAGGYFFIQNRIARHKAPDQVSSEILPGTNKAVLTLSNGRQISLSDARNGTLTEEGDQRVKKADDGTIAYESKGSSNGSAAVVYNTISTPRGGQWTVILPDGTKVTLDATSSIKYPVRFSGRERSVAVSGQMYFEVAHNKKMPFHVRTGNQDIEVLGTHFNVNVYPDEPDSRVTLLEGSIRLSNQSRNAVLKPGQQAITRQGTDHISIERVNAEDFIAWKTGRFFFNNANIQTVMRQLSRWYDVDVSYKGVIPHQQFNGDIQRNLKATEILDILSNYYNIPFKIEGKKIIVGQ